MGKRTIFLRLTESDNLIDFPKLDITPKSIEPESAPNLCNLKFPTRNSENLLIPRCNWPMNLVTIMVSGHSRRPT